MIIIVGGNSYPIDNPEYNYQVTINLALDKIETTDNTVKWYDQDTSNDYRTSRLNLKLNAIQATQFNDLFSNDVEARNSNTSFVLDSSEDLHIFGPDLGNSGTFVCALQNYKIPFQLLSPFRYYDVSFELKLVSNPVYSLPSQINEGDLQIGSTNYLQNTLPDLSTFRNYTTNFTNNGDVYRIDKLENHDYQIMTINIDCNNSNAGRIIYDIVNNIRGNSFNIIAQNNNYFFGIDGGSSGTYSVKLDSNEISVSHVKYNKYVVSFSVRKII